MLPDNIALSIIDVLNFHQKQGHFKVPKRTFSAISLRIHTPGKYIYKNKTVSFEPASVCIIPEGLSYERTAFISISGFCFPLQAMSGFLIFFINGSLEKITC